MDNYLNYNVNFNRHIFTILWVTPFLYIPFGPTYSALPKVFFFSMYTVFIFIEWYMKDKKSLLRFDVYDKTLGLYLLLLCLNFLITPDIPRTIWGIPSRHEGVLTLFVYGMLYFLAKHHFRFNRRYFNGLIFILCLFSAHGIMQYYGVDFMPRATFQENWHRAFSTFGNPNFFSAYLVLMLPLPMFAYLYQAMNKKTLINGYLLATGLVYYCLLATLTRSGWVGFFASCLLFIILVRLQGYHWKYLIMLFTLLAILTLIFDILSQGQIFGRLLRILLDAGSVVLQTEGFENAGSHRWFIWMKVVDLIKMYPLLGVGIETLDLAFDKFFYMDVVSHLGYYLRFDKAHNEYLHIAVTAGIPALLVYLVFIGRLVRKAVSSYAQNHLSIPLLCSIIGYLVQAFFNISTVFASYAFWLFLGATLAISQNNNDSDKIVM